MSKTLDERKSEFSQVAFLHRELCDSLREFMLSLNDPEVLEYAIKRQRQQNRELNKLIEELRKDHRKTLSSH